MSSIPLVIDDPDKKAGSSCMIMDLYHGSSVATVGKGVSRPISTIVISSNISPIEEERYIAVNVLMITKLKT